MGALFAPVAAVSQTLPEFDESLGFEVTGRNGSNDVFVRNGDTTFTCRYHVTSLSDPFVTINECRPIIMGDKSLAELAPLMKKREELLIKTLYSSPKSFFFAPVGQALGINGCEFEVDVLEDNRVRDRMARFIAHWADYEYPLSPEAVEEIIEMVRVVATAMKEEGLVVIEGDSARLTDCG